MLNDGVYEGYVRKLKMNVFFIIGLQKLDTQKYSHLTMQKNSEFIISNNTMERYDHVDTRIIWMVMVGREDIPNATTHQEWNEWMGIHEKNMYFHAIRFNG